MTIRYLVLARHGQSEANRKLQKTSCGLYYSLCGSDREVPLTNEGLNQADDLGDRLRKLFPLSRRLSRVYENGFLRVQQTADRALAKLEYPVEREAHPDLEKRHYGKFWNLTRRGVKKLYPDEWKRYRRQGDLLYRAPEGGENYPDVFNRVDRFIDERVMPAQENLLIITSSIVALSFQRRLEGLSDNEVFHKYEAMAVPNADIRVYCREPDGAWLQCDPASLV